MSRSKSHIINDSIKISAHKRKSCASKAVSIAFSVCFFFTVFVGRVFSKFNVIAIFNTINWNWVWNATIQWHRYRVYRRRREKFVSSQIFIYFYSIKCSFRFIGLISLVWWKKWRKIKAKTFLLCLRAMFVICRQCDTGNCWTLQSHIHFHWSNALIRHWRISRN